VIGGCSWLGKLWGKSVMWGGGKGKGRKKNEVERERERQTARNPQLLLLCDALFFFLFFACAPRGSQLVDFGLAEVPSRERRAPWRAGNWTSGGETPVPISTSFPLLWSREAVHINRVLRYGHVSESIFIISSAGIRRSRDTCPPSHQRARDSPAVASCGALISALRLGTEAGMRQGNRANREVPIENLSRGRSRLLRPSSSSAATIFQL